jgi:hypothetical protein
VNNAPPGYTIMLFRVTPLGAVALARSLLLRNWCGAHPVVVGAVAISIEILPTKLRRCLWGTHCRFAGNLGMSFLSPAWPIWSAGTMRLISPAVAPGAGGAASLPRHVRLSSDRTLERATTCHPDQLADTRADPLCNLNVGQGALDFTLATGSAQIIADLAAGRPAASRPPLLRRASHRLDEAKHRTSGARFAYWSNPIG